MSVKRLISLVLCMALPALCGGQEAEREVRAVWAHAWSPGYLTPASAQVLVDNVRKASLNTIFLQVRKAGDAYYLSGLEPRAGNTDKNFDPLRTVIDLAHDTSGGRQRLEVHAWVVVYRVLRVPDGTRNIFKNLPPGHILARKPEWVMTNDRGRRTMDGNVFVDPGVPGVTEHTVEVLCDLAKKYEVDGIHLDYVRYPESDDCSWGYNPISLRRFNRIYGRDPSSRPMPSDKRWTEWRRKNVSDFVRRLYYELHSVRPAIKVSAATVAWGEPKYNFKNTKAYAQVLQDWAKWLDKGWLDMAVPMIYKRGRNKRQSRDFDHWVARAAAMANGRQVVIGQGSFLNSRYHSGLQIKILRAARPAGFALYSYQNPYAGRDPKFETFSSYIAPRCMRRKAGIPQMPWLDAPRTSTVAGTVRLKDGSAVERLKIRIGRLETETDATGFFVFDSIRPDRYTIEAWLDGEWKTVSRVKTEKGKIRKLRVLLQSIPRDV